MFRILKKTDIKSGWRVHIALIVLFLLFMGGHILLNSDSVQHLTAKHLVTLLEKSFGTKVMAESVELKRPCGLTIDNLIVFDLKGDTLASFRSVTVRMRLLPLLHNKLSITSIQVSRPEIYIYRDSVGKDPNFQFIVDKFSNKDSVKSKLNIRINSIIIRNGTARYDIKSESETPGLFNPSHIHIQGLSTILSIKALSADSLNILVRQFKVKEKSGLKISGFEGSAEIGKNSFLFRNMSLSSANSHINADRIEFEKELFDNGLDTPASIYINLCESYFSPSDISALFPELSHFNDRLNICASLNGNAGQINLSMLEISSSKKEFSIAGSGSFKNLSEIEKIKASNTKISVSVSSALGSYLEEELRGLEFVLPPLFKNIGNAAAICQFSGDISDFLADMSIISDVGTIHANINSDKNRQSITINANSIDFKTVTGNTNLGEGSFSLAANGMFFEQRPTDIQFSCLIDSMDFKEYKYRGMNIGGNYFNDTLHLDLKYHDRNASVNMAAKYSRADSNRHSLTMELTTDSINMPALNLVDNNGFQYLSANVKVNVFGSNLDELRGDVSVDNLELTDSENVFFLNNITFMAKDVLSEQRIITLNTDFLSFAITGNFSITTLPQSLHGLLYSALPSFTDWTLDKLSPEYTVSASENVFLIDVRLRDTDFFEKVLKKQLRLGGTTTLHCYINDLENVSEIEFVSPMAKIGQNIINEGRLQINQYNDVFSLTMRGSHKLTGGSATFVDLFLTGSDNMIDGSISWQNDIKKRFEGILSAIVNFGEYNRGDKWMMSQFHIDTAEISLQNIDWKISPAIIEADSGQINISNFKLAHNDQFIEANGVISADSSDIINVVIKKIDIEQLFGMFKNSGEMATGTVSGDISVLSLLDKPAFFGHLEIDNFSFLESYGGSLLLDAEWNKFKKRIDISAEMKNKNISRSLINGFFTPATKEIDMSLKADNTDLYFLNRFTKKIFKELRGKASGDMRVYGKLNELNLEGRTIVDSLYLEQANLNTLFFVERDTLWFEKNLMNFKNVEISDIEGNKGNMTCLVRHTGLKNFQVDLKADINNMLILNLIKSENSPLFARVYAKGSVSLNAGDSYGLSVQAKAKTGPGSKFGYNIDSQNVADYEFLKIVNRSTILSAENDGDELSNKKKANLRLDLDVECTKDADITLIMNSLQGSFNGVGNITAQYNPVDGIFLNGIYNVDYGVCDLSIQDLIKKEFSMMENSFVRFNGPPVETELSLRTYHTVNSASIYDLAADANSSSNVRVRCLMDITGLVENPSFKFDIDMPQATAEEKDILSSATSTEEQRNMQFMYLLAVGRFYTYDYSNGTYAYGLSPNAMESLLNSTVSGQINNILSQLFHSSSISLSSNVSAGSYLSNNADNIANKELEGILEARLLNNRLLVNGNFGYRENTITNTSNFIGDFEVQWLLFPKQGISLKGYNKNNDRYFSKTTLTTQGVGVVFETDFDRIIPTRRRYRDGRLIGTSE